MEVTSYTIEERSEEAQCDRCGYPMYIGDRCHRSEGHYTGGMLFCSRSCAEREERYRTPGDPMTPELRMIAMAE